MNLEFIKSQNLDSLLMKSSQSNFDLRSPSSTFNNDYGWFLIVINIQICTFFTMLIYDHSLMSVRIIASVHWPIIYQACNIYLYSRIFCPSSFNKSLKWSLFSWKVKEVLFLSYLNTMRLNIFLFWSRRSTDPETHKTRFDIFWEYIAGTGETNRNTWGKLY